MSQSSTIADHDFVRRRARSGTAGNGRSPAWVKATDSGDDPGISGFDFGKPEDSLEETSWDEFFGRIFEEFDEHELAVLHEDGRNSRFDTLIDRRKS